MIDVLIITYNEALNLPQCLAALRGWTRRIFVVDSGSTDGTPELARQRGAEVVVHPWSGYARQKNWALANLPFAAPWVLIVDADEVIADALRRRLVEIASRPVEQVPENGFFVNRLTYFMGRPIRHCGYFPSWNLRFFKRGLGHYENREVHEHVIIADPVGYLREPMLHDDRRGLEHYVAKHNRYSTLEARALFLETSQAEPPGDPANISSSTRRRRWLKRYLMPHMPWPGLWRFAYMYVVRAGILDGRAGLEFCRFIAMYDSLVALKLRDLRRLARAGGDAVAAAAPGVAALAQPEGAEPARPRPDAVRPGLSMPPQRPMVSASTGTPASARAVAPPGDPGAAARPLPRHPEADAWVAQAQPDRLPPGNWPALRSVPVSVLIPVKNEQANLVACMRRLLWADQMVVVDSRSTDLTVPIAQAMGAEVYRFHYPPEGWPKKKNWALEHVPWRNEWVLILDADEHVTPELAAEIVQVVRGHYQPADPRQAGCGDGYWLNRKFMFMGQWIRGCGYYPSYNVRLFKHRVGRYERIGDLGDTGSGDNEVHEHVVLSSGPAGYLSHDFLHYAYPDLNTWIEKHNRYSNWEAHAMAADNRGAVAASPLGGPIERRRWAKQVARRLPWRPTLRFIYSYILKRGFLDGYPGYVMSRLLGWYEFVSIAKLAEMQRRKRQGGPE